MCYKFKIKNYVFIKIKYQKFNNKNIKVSIDFLYNINN